jgi:Biotin-lipoyl like
LVCFFWGTTIKRWIITGLICLILLSIIPVPSRIYAPCEIVAEKQQPVNAPFDGVIKNIAVETGDLVTAGQLLFSYDKGNLMRELKTTRENFENADIEPLREREKQHPQLLQDRLEELNVKATIEGTTNVHGKEEWQGRKILAGEHVLSISDPKDTMLRISLPKGKEIVISPDRPIKVYFNGDSERSYKAGIIHVNADQVALENGTLSFTAEAVWKKTPKDLHVGEKGEAILSGQNVPLIYWLVHMPFSIIF